MAIRSAKQLIAAAAACLDCGREHLPRQVGERQWTWAEKDGHNYRPRLGAMVNNGGAVVAELRRLLEEDATGKKG